MVFTEERQCYLQNVYEHETPPPHVDEHVDLQMKSSLAIN